MSKGLLIFGGTYEGRILAEALSQAGVFAHVFTATAYGGTLIEKLPNLSVHAERLDAEQMLEFMKAHGIERVIDATHPYAREVTSNIVQAAQKAGVEYIRVVRGKSSLPADCSPISAGIACGERLCDTTSGHGVSDQAFLKAAGNLAMDTDAKESKDAMGAKGDVRETISEEAQAGKLRTTELDAIKSSATGPSVTASNVTRASVVASNVTGSSVKESRARGLRARGSSVIELNATASDATEPKVTKLDVPENGPKAIGGAEDALKMLATDGLTGADKLPVADGLPVTDGLPVEQPVASVYHAGITHVADTAGAVAYLATTQGPVLVTTGSKELDAFCALPDFAERLYIRVLPLSEVLARCYALGFLPAHVIAMQGPFGYEMNAAMLRQYGCRYLVTKNTGKAGGMEEKVRAALECGVEVVLIERPPDEEGLALSEVLRLLELTDTTVERQ